MSSDRGIRGRWKSFELGAGSWKPGAAAEGAAEGASEGALEATAEDEAQADPLTSTFIGTGALFQGTLRLTGDFAIDSDFQGSLTTDGCLTVGPSGSVEGDIHAREVIVEGAVVGNIAARRQLIVRASAQIHGDLETACLEIERHAFFNGRTTMTRPQANSRARPPEEKEEKVTGEGQVSAPPA